MPLCHHDNNQVEHVNMPVFQEILAGIVREEFFSASNFCLYIFHFIPDFAFLATCSILKFS